jgi:uncharacterized protein (DUF58 family)
VSATFPLVPRRRVMGLAFGGMRSARRGIGSDVAGSRPYRPGDDVAAIDWNASARLSAARASDEFVVREHFSDESARVVVVCDRRPSLGIDSPLRSFRKPQAVRHAVELVAASATAAHGLVGYLDHADGSTFWRVPRSEHELEPLDLTRRPFRAPADTLARAFDQLEEQRRALATAAFVFVVSDFLEPPDARRWQRALEHRWELVPVVIQDPVWERSFPDVAGVVFPFADPATGRVAAVRLTVTEVRARREAHERRWADLLRGFRALGLEPVVPSGDERADMLAAFLAWADLRLLARGAL